MGNYGELITAGVIGIFSSIIASFIWHKFSHRLPSLNNFGHSSINGIWAGRFISRKDEPCVNIYKFKEKNGKVVGYIEHYVGGSNSRMHKIHAIGLYYFPSLSLAYQFNKSKISINGAIVARLGNGVTGNHNMRFFYSQYIEEPNNKNISIRPHHNEIVLTRIQIPVMKQLRVLLGKNYFSGYYEIPSQYKTD